MVGSGAYTTLNEPAHASAFNEVVVLLLGLYVCLETGIPVLSLPVPRSHLYKAGPNANRITASNAFIYTTVIIGQISFAVPAALLLIRRHSTDYPLPKRVFRISTVLGYIANSVCVVWAVVLTVLFTSPTEFPVTGG